jgi:chromosome segregation ATPase
MIAKGRPLGEIQARWTAFLEGATKGGGAVDPNALVQWVLTESYKQTNEDLKLYADKVKHFNELKAKLRDEIQKARLAQGTALGVARQEADARRRQLEDKLNTVGDDAQLANVDLQNILQKQQQTLQMMSNISKMLYDTANSVIRKIGG